MDDKPNLKEPLKSKNPFELPGDDDEEEVVEDSEKQVLNINMNKKVENNKISYVSAPNELLSNKPKQIRFLRSFLTIFISQIICVSLVLALTLMKFNSTFILNNEWFSWVGLGFYILLFIPVLLGLTKLTKPAIVLIIGIDVTLIMMISQITALIGNPIGYITFVSIDCMLVSIYFYSWIISESFNYLISFLISFVCYTLYLGVSYYIIEEKYYVFLSYYIANIILSFVISYASHLHISDWMIGGDYKEDDFLHPGVRLHYDYIMIVLKKISDCRSKKNK